jgi:hypothetical protein
LPLYELGGLYLDVDVTIDKWDENVHHFFDYFTYATSEVYPNPDGKPTTISELHPGNDIMAAKVNHPITGGYISSLISII